MDTEFFADAGHAQQYLSQSVIRHKGEPIWVSTVHNVERKITLVYCALTEQKIDQDGGRDYKEISITDKSIDFTPVDLGYLNIKRFNNYSAYKVFRIPVRAWKIGLTFANISIIPGGSAVKNLMFTKEMRDTILGRYPEFMVAAERVLKKEKSMCAFSRRFAISNKGELHHLFLDNPVGEITSKGKPSLNKEFMFLSEALTEDMS